MCNSKKPRVCRSQRSVSPLPRSRARTASREEHHALLRNGMLRGCSCDRCKHTANLWHTLSLHPRCFQRRREKETQPNKNRRRHTSAKRRRHRSLSSFRPPSTPDSPNPVTAIHSSKVEHFSGMALPPSNKISTILDNSPC